MSNFNEGYCLLKRRANACMLASLDRIQEMKEVLMIDRI